MNIKELSILVLIGIIMAISHGCNHARQSQESKNMATGTEINPLKMSATELKEVYFVPPYLRAASHDRHLYDTCIFERDTMEFRGRKFAYACYFLFPALCKCENVNFSISSYKNQDTTWIRFAVTFNVMYIRHTKNDAMFVGVGDQLFPYEYGFESVEEILKIFNDAPAYCNAPLDEEGVVRKYRSQPWQVHFNKIYREDGLELKSKEFPKFKFFIRYPYRLEGSSFVKSRREKATMLPPWLFWDLSDYFCYFSPGSCIGRKVPDFSNFPGADTSSVVPVKYNDPNIYDLVPYD